MDGRETVSPNTPPGHGRAHSDDCKAPTIFLAPRVLRINNYVCVVLMAKICRCAEIRCAGAACRSGERERRWGQRRTPSSSRCNNWAGRCWARARAVPRVTALSPAMQREVSVERNPIVSKCRCSSFTRITSVCILSPPPRAVPGKAALQPAAHTFGRRRHNIHAPTDLYCLFRQHLIISSVATCLNRALKMSCSTAAVS